LRAMRSGESRMKGDERILGQGDFVETVLKAKKNGTGSKRAMLLGDARTRDERGIDIEKTEHRVLYGERIRDERTANCRGARMEAFERGQIRESEERPLTPSSTLRRPGDSKCFPWICQIYADRHRSHRNLHLGRLKFSI